MLDKQFRKGSCWALYVVVLAHLAASSEAHSSEVPATGVPVSQNVKTIRSEHAPLARKEGQHPEVPISSKGTDAEVDLDRSWDFQPSSLLQTEESPPSKICVFLHLALDQDDLRQRALASVGTWGQAAEDTPNLSIYYLVDPDDRLYFDGLVKESQIVPWQATRKGDWASLMVARLLLALNDAVQERNCGWVILPEDDTYLNTPIVAAKLALLDRLGKVSVPVLLGTVYDVSNPGYVPPTFVHGDFYVTNKHTLPMLLKAAEECELGTHNGPHVNFGDLALAECLVHSHQKVKSLLFGCFVRNNNNSTDTVEEAKSIPEPECLDVFHKVLPEDMHKMHKLLKGKTCQWDQVTLMKRCGVRGWSPGLSIDRDANYMFNYVKRWQGMRKEARSGKAKVRSRSLLLTLEEEKLQETDRQAPLEERHRTEMLSDMGNVVTDATFLPVPEPTFL